MKRNKYYKLITKILENPLLLKIVLVASIFLIIFVISTFSRLSTTLVPDPEVTVESTKPKRHSLVIYKSINVPKDSKFSRFKYEYYTDAQTIWSSEIYAVGDTLSYTTRKVKRQYFQLEKENIALKAEISQRDKNWENIQVDIMKILQQYN